MDTASMKTRRKRESLSHSPHFTGGVFPGRTPFIMPPMSPSIPSTCSRLVDGGLDGKPEPEGLPSLSAMNKEPSTPSPARWNQKRYQ